MRALVLSGGGAKGSYQSSAVYHLLNDLQVPYEVLCGVSVGAISCAFLAQFPIGQEQEAAKQLCDLWSSISTKDIYKRYFPFGKFHSLWRSSLLDSSPLTKLIHTNISLAKIRSSGKQVCVGAVSACSGEYRIFTQHDDDFVDAVIASSSFPGLLQPVKMRGQYWMDGGCAELTPIKTAIDAGATELDIIMTSPDKRNIHFVDHPTVGEIIKRALDLSIDKIMDNDIERLDMYNRLVVSGASKRKMIDYRIIRPEYNLIEDLLDFDPVKIKRMMELGYLDAKRICTDI